MEGAIGVKHRHWQWGDSGCPARLAPAGQGDPEGCCSPDGTGSGEAGMGVAVSSGCASAQRGFGGSPDPLPRLSVIVSCITAPICIWKGHVSPQQKALSWPVAKAASTLAATVTNCFHRPRQRVCNEKK